MTTCFDVFAACVRAVRDGELIVAESSRDKEYHFQNWFQQRLGELGLAYDPPARNSYPDFRLVSTPEGYELKALAWPGRERDYDCNSQVPTGHHNGRQILYVFGRYPAEGGEADTHGDRGLEYPVVDLVICHGDFLNADHDYVHANRHVPCFGSYGDIMIRDRKMYVAPTPLALTSGTTGLLTLILPENVPPDPRYAAVGRLSRLEAPRLVVGYSFDLKTNAIEARTVPNPQAGAEHRFVAYRLAGDARKPVSMVPPAPRQPPAEEQP